MTAPRILIARTGALGDSLLLWPAICALRSRYPAARIALLGHARRLGLLVGAGGADRVLEMEGSGFHRFYLPGGSVSGPLAAELIGGTVLVFAAPGAAELRENLLRAGAAAAHLFPPFPPESADIHLADYLVGCVEQIGLGKPVPWRPLPLGERDLEQGRRCLPHLPPGPAPVLLCPGSGAEGKNWPAANWAELAARLFARGRSVFLLRGPADEAAVAGVLKLLSRQPFLLEAPTPAALKGALSRFSLAVGNDSGPVHLAALLGLPALALFGPTDPRRFAPRGPRAFWLAPRGIECAPCSENQRNACPRRRCLEAISVAAVWRKIDEVLGG